MTDDLQISCHLDTRGTRCPIPLLRAKQALKTMQPGELLEVLSTDPSAKGDFDAMLRHLPHEMVLHSQMAETPVVDRIVIRKGAE
ncbi:hypothetical protein GCM10008090_16140 [Arenicella chitinivorans]|uniref:UPF0033 domain-containing protein n=1 Tax=Arenicella chitinivorans TaxID=1329800 RepID=A0A918VM71_9GAMM|nr:sulfurtransferase TusA family protein [Arenicella chitinivorans]GHA07148.1 hypothetical protein GCM10008090_16140 [Arenicella chitinivorans]